MALLLIGPLAGHAACSDARETIPGPGIGPVGSGGTSTATGGASGTPTEVELEENFRAPVVSGPYLWTANPESNRIAVIQAETLEVQVVAGGDGPTFLAALPGGDQGGGALVLNLDGQDASVFRHDSGVGFGGANASDIEQSRVRVQAGASAWTVGASGRFAIAWSRFQDDLKGPLDGYQDLTVLDLEGGQVKATKLSVGFRPTQVVINQAETRAYAVCRPGLSVIDLTQDPPVVLRELALPEEEGGRSRDVSLTRDGGLSLVRIDQKPTVLVVDTETDQRTTITLPRPVTDLDLSADGTTAVAVMRPLTFGVDPGGGEGGLGGEGGAAAESDAEQESLIALLQIPEIQEDPDAFELVSTPEFVGSTVVADDASFALLYTNAIANSHLTILDLGTRTTRVVDVTAPIQAAFLAPNARHAVTVMTPPPGSQLAGAFALVPVQQALPARIEGTDTVPRFVAVSSDAALLTTWGSSSLPAVSLLGRFPSLIVDKIPLKSEPLASGLLLEANRGFVAQAHPQGRVTFVDLETADAPTVTGFELSSQVVDP